MLIVTERVQIPSDELDWSFVRSGGPGGQNVNKVASKAVLRWKTTGSTAAIPEPAYARMRARFPSRFTAGGDVLIQSQQYRDQERNRADCLTKLVEMIRGAPAEPRPQGDPADQGSQTTPCCGQAGSHRRNATGARRVMTNELASRKMKPTRGQVGSNCSGMHSHWSRSSMSSDFASP